jgi:hypothetical protein
MSRNADKQGRELLLKRLIGQAWTSGPGIDHQEPAFGRKWPYNGQHTAFKEVAVYRPAGDLLRDYRGCTP